MKILKITLFVLTVAIFAAGCGGSNATDATVTEAVETTETETKAETVAYIVNSEQSVIRWTGRKLAGSMHTGTLRLANGELKVEGGTVVGGKFVVDMNSLENEDLKGTDMYDKLVGHLRSDDFFSIEAHPTATFEITGVEGNQVSGNLTIKGITKNITFPAAVTADGGVLTGSATFAFDRSQFDVHFGSKTKFTDLAADKIINDDIELTVELVAEKAGA